MWVRRAATWAEAAPHVPLDGQASQEGSTDVNDDRGTAIGNRDDVDTTDPAIAAISGNFGNSSANEDHCPGIADSAGPNLIPYYYDRDGIVTLRPASMGQCKDFPELLDRARQLGADKVGVFKCYQIPSAPGPERQHSR